jgi:hypothetical protein
MSANSAPGPDVPIDPARLIERLIISTREGTTFWFKDEYILDTILPIGIKVIFFIQRRDGHPHWQLFLIYSDGGELFRATRSPDAPDPTIPTPVDQLFAAVLQSSPSGDATPEI